MASKGLVSRCCGERRVSQREIELRIVHIVQEEVHARQVVGGVVDFLPHETLLDQVLIKLTLGLQQQRARTARGVVDFVHLVLPRERKPRQQPRDVLGREKLAARLTGIGGIVGNEKLVGIAEEVDLVVGKAAEVQTLHPVEHGTEAAVLLLDGVAQAGAGGVEVGKKPLDGALGVIAHGRGFDGGEDRRQVGVEVGVVVGLRHHHRKELTGVDEIALFARHLVDHSRIGTYFAVGIFLIAFLGIVPFHVGDKVFADEAVEERAEHKLFKVPAVDSAAHFVGDAPNGGLQFGALGDFGHRAVRV